MQYVTHELKYVISSKFYICVYIYAQFTRFNWKIKNKKRLQDICYFIPIYRNIIDNYKPITTNQ